MERLTQNTQRDRTGVITNVIEIEGRLMEIEHRLQGRFFL